jgi:hypothetical protein
LLPVLFYDHPWHSPFGFIHGDHSWLPEGCPVHIWFNYLLLRTLILDTIEPGATIATDE